MKRFSLAFAASLLVAVAAGAQTNGSLLTCESINNVRHTCKVDVTHGVTLNRQLSNDSCVRGRTWGTTRNNKGIWVDGGCRAEFLVNNLQASQMYNSRTIVCDAGRNGHRCPTDTSSGVQLTRQLSKHSCNLGTDWGYDNNGIWVKNGCRAEFTLGGAGNAPMSSGYYNNGSNNGSTIICESSSGNNNHCAANTMHGVTLSRQLSSAACVQGQTWGYDRDGVWVANGCRAEFIVGRNP